MNINPKNKIHNNINYRASVNKSTPQTNNYPDDKLVRELDKMSMINNVGFLKKDYELNLSHEELEKRTHKDYLTTKKMLAVDAPEFLNLADGDKEALKH